MSYIIRQLTELAVKHEKEYLQVFRDVVVKNVFERNKDDRLGKYNHISNVVNKRNYE